MKALLQSIARKGKKKQKKEHCSLFLFLFSIIPIVFIGAMNLYITSFLNHFYVIYRHDEVGKVVAIGIAGEW